MTRTDRKVLGRYLKEQRLKAGITQKVAADVLKFKSPQFVSNLERGLCSFPIKKLRILIRLYKGNPQELADLISENFKRRLNLELLGR